MELQRYYLPLYPTVGIDGKFTSFATRWEETLAGRGQAYTSDTSLVSRIVSAAYSDHPSECPSDAVVEALVKRTLLSASSIRSLFKKHHEQAEKTRRWEAPHGTAAADGDGVARMDSDIITYDETLVGRRCTAFWSPPEGEKGEEGYYAATVVAYNSLCSALLGRWLLHFDDGQRERVDLPDETVRIMTTYVAVCKCQNSPGGQLGCCQAAGGSQKIPRPWEAKPK